MLSPNDSKQAKVQARRDQIVEAAKTSFRRHGFHAASMAEIAQARSSASGKSIAISPIKTRLSRKSSTASSPARCSGWKTLAITST